MYRMCKRELQIQNHMQILKLTDAQKNNMFRVLCAPLICRTSPSWLQYLVLHDKGAHKKKHC